MPRLSVVVLVVLSSCLCEPTPSIGHVQVFITGMTKAQVKDVLIADAVAGGWEVEKSDATGVAFIGSGTDLDPKQVYLFTAIDWEEGFSPADYTRIRYKLVSRHIETGSVFLMAQIEIIRDVGRAAEFVQAQSVANLRAMLRDKLKSLFPVMD